VLFNFKKYRLADNICVRASINRYKHRNTIYNTVTVIVELCNIISEKMDAYVIILQLLETNLPSCGVTSWALTVESKWDGIFHSFIIDLCGTHSTTQSYCSWQSRADVTSNSPSSFMKFWDAELKRVWFCRGNAMFPSSAYLSIISLLLYLFLKSCSKESQTVDDILKLHLYDIRKWL
jgi:hypothetical protein